MAMLLGQLQTARLGASLVLTGLGWGRFPRCQMGSEAGRREGPGQDWSIETLGQGLSFNFISFFN